MNRQTVAEQKLTTTNADLLQQIKKIEAIIKPVLEKKNKTLHLNKK